MMFDGLPQLQFINPVGFDTFGEFDAPNLFTTVRLGDKWKKITNKEDLLEIWFCEESHYGRCGAAKGCGFKGTAEVHEHWYGALRDVPARLIQHEHNKQCRELEGLKQRLNEIYGGHKFRNEVTLDDNVTVVTFNDEPMRS